MKFTVILVFFGTLLYGGASTSDGASWASNFSCGIDKSPYFGALFVGVGEIETYPWLGMLVYPVGDWKITAVVVLVTRQVAVTLASNIEKLPKHDFRFRSRVVLGRACDGPADDGIMVREYAFPPHYSPEIADIAMLQLDVDHVREDCATGKILMYKVKPVSLPRCKNYYKKFGNKVDDWPAKILCVRAAARSNCRWREGSLLVLKQSGQWSFMGFTLRGSGCQGPARFVDYAAQHHWLRQSVARAGFPAITRVADNMVVMRRTSSNIQRFGPCDAEEQKFPLYTDNITIELNQLGMVSYNLTLIHDMEYSCVIMQVKPILVVFDEDPPHPKINLRRWCAGPPKICYSYHLTEINYFVNIEMIFVAEFTLAVYGRQAKYISPVKALRYSNSFDMFPSIPIYQDLKPYLAHKTTLLSWLHS